APPFVPTAAVRDVPSAQRTTADETGSRAAAGSTAAKPASQESAEPAISPGAKTGAPEPLKIDLAPVADRSPRPLKTMGDEPTPAARPQQKAGSADSHIADPFASPAREAGT